MNKVQQFLAKNILGIDVKAASVPGTNTRYQLMNGVLTMITDNTDNYIKKGYAVNDIVYSIVKLITDKVKVAPWNLYKVVDESSLKKSQALLNKADVSPQDIIQAKNLRKKALEIFTGSNKITDLLKYPNEYCTMQDFVGDAVGYKLLTGNSYIWADLLKAGANQGSPNGLYLMPSQFIQILALSGFPGAVTGYRLQVLGSPPYTTEEVLHIKDANYRWSVNGEQHYGMSPLKAGLMRLNRSNSALESSTARFQNNGADGLIFIDEPNIPPNQRKDALDHANKVKAQWITENTGTLNSGKVVTSGHKMGFIPIGISPADLKILESEKADLRFLCNLYGVPSQLMNDPENKSFNNVKESEKALTSRCALPQLICLRDGLNRKFSSDWGMKPGFMIDFDMSVYNELQETVGETMRWIEPLLNNGLPPNMAFELMGLDTVDDPRFDEPWIKQGMGVPLSEWDAGMTNGDLGGSLDETNI